MEEPKITVTGANGFVGTNLRRLLRSKRIRVLSLTRKKCKSSLIEKNISFSDLTQGNVVREAKGSSALVHLIGSGAQTIHSDYESVNVQITKQAVLLCKLAGIKKIVYISGLGVSPNTTFGYFISKLKAESELVRSGLDYTIFRASYIVGRGDPLSKNLLRQARSGAVIIPGSGSYRLQPISVDDVSKVILDSIANRKLSKKIVDLVGPRTITFESYAKKFAKSRGVATKKIDLERAYWGAINNPRRALYGLDDLNILVGDFTSNHKRLEKLCGFNLKIP